MSTMGAVIDPVALRSSVVKMYKTLIRLGRGWSAKDPSQTVVERDYIVEETRRLFKLNSGLASAKDVTERLREAEARLAMAEHYRNPYPRPVNLPPKSFTAREGKQVGKRIKELNEMSRPIYVRSISDESPKN